MLVRLIAHHPSALRLSIASHIWAFRESPTLRRDVLGYGQVATHLLVVSLHGVGYHAKCRAINVNGYVA